MTTFKIYFLALSLFFDLHLNVLSQESPELLLQTGIYAEEVQGDLIKAVAVFNKIIQNYPDHRPIAANALLHIGYCYEKMGQDRVYEAYQKIIEQYPDQREVAAIARERLKNYELKNLKSEIRVDPLVNYYFERLGIDILTSTSFDGKFLAYTDWTTGNLMIKNLVTGYRRKLTVADWSRSYEFALRPIWSHDGKSIAYSWYRKSYFNELRVVDITTGISRVVFSHPDLSISPQDWHPDGTMILCNITNFKRDRRVRLALVDLYSSEIKDFLPLDINSRCIKFSPDGKYIAYDTQQKDHRHIFIYDRINFRASQVSAGLYGGKGFDAPIWSPDGKLLLFRSIRLGQYDLWAMLIADGKPSGESYLVQSDLTNALLAIKGIDHRAPTKSSQLLIHEFIEWAKKGSNQSFFEDFTTPALDSSWFVFEWNQPNIYDYDSFGRYSLTANPGQLRLYLDPIMAEAYIHNSLPTFSGWYWLYPGLQINRILAGESWKLETKVTYSMVDGAAGRAFDLMICFDPESDRSTSLIITRSKDFGGNKLEIRLLDRGEIISSNENCLAPGDTIGITDFTYIYNISRNDTLVQVELSDDNGKTYRQVLSGLLRSSLRDLPQLLVLTGNCWFVPAGSYADYDYIRFTNYDFRF